MIYKNENTYNREINQVSKKLGIPIPIIKSIIARESNFNPNAYRYEPHIKDASYGLTQILYSTAKKLGFKDKPNKLFDPYTNIYYGMLYFKSLLDKYKNLDDAIASYNMGHPRPANKTTDIIINIFGIPEPHWKYANQPYVDDVKQLIKYFETGQKPIFTKIKKPVKFNLLHLIIPSLILYALSKSTKNKKLKNTFKLANLLI